MCRYTTRGWACCVAVLPLLMAAVALLPPAAQAQDTGPNWGVNSNGWNICLMNTTARPLDLQSPLPTDNVASAPQRILPHSQSCDIRGEPSVFGGPADMNFNYAINGCEADNASALVVVAIR